MVKTFSLAKLLCPSCLRFRFSPIHWITKRLTGCQHYSGGKVVEEARRQASMPYDRHPMVVFYDANGYWRSDD